MSNIESIGSSFFPKVKSDALSKTNKALLKRNSDVREEEINLKTRDDAKVDVGTVVKDFAKIKKVADATPPKDNLARIEALKAQINAGTYKVDYDGLADKMLKEEF